MEIKRQNFAKSVDKAMSTVLLNTDSGKNLALAWINLSYTRKNIWGKSTTILSHLKGQINFGTLTALMGPSGAGKTTLLRCVNGLNGDGIGANAEIYVNKYEPLRPCFIVQDVKEHLLVSLTVDESMRYAYKLKNRTETFRSGVSGRSMGTSIYELLRELMLTDCADNVVTRCSDGEQKRLVIAMELTSLVKPNLICIDEPTSGLDSNAAEQTMQCLLNISRAHHLAVVTSIHQPNSDILTMFDALYVLAKGGRCVYSGTPSALKDHLRRCQIQCLDSHVPIEVMLKIASKRNKTFDNDLMGIDLGPPDEIVNMMIETYDSMAALRAKCLSHAQLTTRGLSRKTVTIHPIDFWHVFCRSALYTWIRQWKTNAAQGLILIAFAVLLVKVYRSDIGTDASCLAVDNCTNYDDTLPETSKLDSAHSYEYAEHMEPLAQQNLKFIFFLSSVILFIQMNATVFTISSEVKIFLNEHRNRWYSTASYYWAKTVIELPLSVTITCIYCWIGYYCSSQPDLDRWYDPVYRPSARFALFVLFINMGVLCVQGLSILVGIIFCRNFRLAAVTVICVFLVDMVFCGFFVPLYSLSSWSRDATYLSFMREYFLSVLIILYGRHRCPGSVSSILVTLDIDESELWSNFYWLLGHLLFCRLAALAVLTAKANPEWTLTAKKKNQSQAIYQISNNINNNFTLNAKL